MTKEKMKNLNFARIKDFVFAKQGRMGQALLLFVSFFLIFYFVSIHTKASANYTPLSAKIPFYAQNVSANPSINYQITIEKKDSSTPAPDVDNLVIKCNQSGEFTVVVTEPGTYEYKVYQTKGNEAYVDYDKKVYDVFLCVVNDAGGELAYTVSATLEGSSVKPDRILFANRWTKTDPAPAPVNPPKPEDEAGRNAAISNIISFKTGEYRIVRIAVYAGIMLLIGIAAFVYVSVKKSQDKEHVKNAENE